MLDYVVQLGKISSFQNHRGSGLVFKSHSKKTAVHRMSLHRLQLHSIHVSKLRWKVNMNLVKMPNGLRSQQRLPLGAWDSYMQIANVVDKAVDGQVEPVIV
jgi:hypothetical protein